MNNAIIMKMVLSSTIILGGSTVSTYFGTRKTIEDSIKKENPNLAKVDNWDEHIKKLPERNARNENQAKSGRFFEIQTGGWQKLKSECENMYSKTYEALWIKHTEDKVKEDVKNYCFNNNSI